MKYIRIQFKFKSNFFNCINREFLSTTSLPKRSLQWRHNERDGISNHRRLHCWFNCWFRCRSEKTSKHRGNGLCEGNSPMAGEFPAQRASNAENVSIWWRHYVLIILQILLFEQECTQHVVAFESRPRLGEVIVHSTQLSNWEKQLYGAMKYVTQKWPWSWNLLRLVMK